MYLSTKDLEIIELAVMREDLRGLKTFLAKYQKEHKEQNKRMKKFMKEKRKENKNYGNHYTYKDGRRR